MSLTLALPRSTYDQRAERLTSYLAKQQLDAALILGPEAQYWLCGYDTFLGAVLPQALIFATDGPEPVQMVWDADVALARQTSLIRDIRTYRFGVDTPASTFARVLKETASPLRRVGVDLSSHAVPYAFGSELVAQIDGVEIVDIAPELARMRSVKTPQELALMRVAGRYGDAGLRAATDRARPGMTEIELAADIEYAMRKAGSDYASIPTELASGTRSVLGHGTPTDRVLEAGDLVHVEIGGVARRYNCVAIQSFTVPGADPDPKAVELYGVARDCLGIGLAQLKPNVRACDVEAPALQRLRDAGLRDGFKMRFGYGVGIGYPPTWLEPLKITRTSDDLLVPGTTFVLHACLLDEAHQLGVLVGGTYAITNDGYEMLSGAGAMELTG